MIDYNTLFELVRNLNSRLSELEVRESGVVPVWKSFVPTFTQNVGMSTSQSVGRWAAIGKLVTVYVWAEFSSSGTPGLVVACDLPLAVPAIASYTGYNSRGSFVLYDPGVAFWVGNVHASNARRLGFFAGSGAGSLLGQSPAMSLTPGDQLSFTITYEST